MLIVFYKENSNNHLHLPQVLIKFLHTSSSLNRQCTDNSLNLFNNFYLKVLFYYKSFRLKSQELTEKQSYCYLCNEKTAANIRCCFVYPVVDMSGRGRRTRTLGTRFWSGSDRVLSENTPNFLLIFNINQYSEFVDNA